MKNKNNLFSIQLAFQEAIMNRNSSKELIDCVAEKPPISTERRIEIYQDAYQIRMVDSLREDFPTVESELSDTFENVALEFLSLHPSKYHNLCEVSHGFPEFLKSKSKRLYDLALKDWLTTLSGYAPEPEINTVVSVEAIQNGEEFMLKKHPASFPNKNGSEYMLAYRYLGESHIVDISKKQWELIQFLNIASSLDAFTKTALELEFSEAELSTLLSEWIKNEIVFCERKIK